MKFNKNSLRNKMPYTSFARNLKQTFYFFSESERTGIPFDEINGVYYEKQKENSQEFSTSRRDFLKYSMLLGAAGGMAGYSMKQAKANQPRVVIIGAGLAGLSCAYKLSKHGLVADVYEADSRIGGRAYSTELNGLVTDHGGSYIASEHSLIRNLVNKLGLQLEVADNRLLAAGEDSYYIDGNMYSYKRASEDWREIWKAFKEELHDAPWGQSYNNFTQRGAELDSISIADWFDPRHELSHPILASFGTDSEIAKLFFSNAIAEYGADYWNQPALNLLYLLAWNSRNSLAPLPGNDEKYIIQGGSERLVDALIANAQANIHTDHPLIAIRGDINGPFECYFEGKSSPVVADKLVLTLPFNILKDIDIAENIRASFTLPKQRAIDEMDMGSNAKVHMELTHKTWGPDSPREIDGEIRVQNGNAYSDPSGFQCMWDATSHLTDGRAILLYYPGGEQGTMLKGKDAFGAADATQTKKLIQQIEPVFPGASSAFTGNAIQSNWAASPWHKGAYAYWGIGSYTSYVGSAGMREGNIHFAGEHTSFEFQGFMEGAVETGLKAAKEILFE